MDSNTSTRKHLLRNDNNDDALKESKSWKIVKASKLRPALVTRQTLWLDYQKERYQGAAVPFSEAATSIAPLLTGSVTFSILDWIIDSISKEPDLVNTAKDTAQGMAVDKCAEHIAGAYATAYDPDRYGNPRGGKNQYAVQATSGFLTILIGAVGGTLSVIGGASTVAVTAIAFVVALGKENEIQKRNRWEGIVGSMMEKYDTIRYKVAKQLEARDMKDMEALVKSNAYHDEEEAGDIRHFTWAKGASGSVTVNCSTATLTKIRTHLATFDSTLAKQMSWRDLLWIFGTFWDDLVGMADDKLPPSFNRDTLKPFMEGLIAFQKGEGELPTRSCQAEQQLARLQEANPVEEHEDDDLGEVHDKDGQGIQGVRAKNMRPSPPFN